MSLAPSTSTVTHQEPSSSPSASGFVEQLRAMAVRSLARMYRRGRETLRLPAPSGGRDHPVRRSEPAIHRHHPHWALSRGPRDRGEGARRLRPGRRLRSPPSRPSRDAEPGRRRPHRLGWSRPGHRCPRAGAGSPEGALRGEGGPANGRVVLGGRRPFPRHGRRYGPSRRRHATPPRFLPTEHQGLSPRGRGRTPARLRIPRLLLRGSRLPHSGPLLPRSCDGGRGVARGRPRLRRVHVPHAGTRGPMVVALRLPDRPRARALSGLRRAPGRHGAHGPVRRGRQRRAESYDRDDPARPRSGSSSSPELQAGTLIDPAADLIWRKVARREPASSHAMPRPWPAAFIRTSACPALDLLFPPRTIDAEDRPYHLGWLLHAFPPKRSAQW